MAMPVTAAMLARIGGPRYTTHWRLLIEDADGAMRDYSDQQGIDWRKSADWGKTVDSPIADGVVEVFMEADGISLAPLIGGSPLNRNSVGGYAKAIDMGRRLQIWTQDTEVGVSPTALDWVLVHDAIIQKVGKGTGTLKLDTLDRAALLHRIIRHDNTYGTELGTPVATVMQSLIDDTLGAGVFTLQLDGDPQYSIRGTDSFRDSSVWEALEQLSAEFAGYVEYRDELTLVTPDRSAPTAASAVASIGPHQYKKVPRLDADLDDIRNDIDLTFRNTATGEIETVNAVDAASKAAYGEQYMGITLSEGSAIDTTAEGQDMADRIVSDIGTPRYDQQVVNWYWYPVELGDHITWQANGRDYDSDQHWAVTGYRHHLSRDKRETIFDVRGKASAGFKRWTRKGDRPTPDARDPRLDLSETDASTDAESVILITASLGDQGRAPIEYRYRVDDQTGTVTAFTAWAQIVPVGSSSGTATITVTRGDYLRHVTVDLRDAGGRTTSGIIGVSPAPPELLALLNFRETELGDTVRWDWTNGERVAEVWIYFATFKKPVPSDPWPTNEPDREPDVILPVGTTTYSYPKPPEGHKTYLQFEPRDSEIPPNAGEIQRATIEGSPGVKPLIGYIGQAPATGAGAHLTNLVAVITDPLSRAGRLTAWLNHGGVDEPDPDGPPDGFIDVTLTNGVRSITDADVWTLTAGGTANLFRDCQLHAQYGKRIYLQWVSEDGEDTGQIDKLLHTWHQIIVGATGEWVEEIVTESAIALRAIGSDRLKLAGVARENVADRAIAGAKIGLGGLDDPAMFAAQVVEEAAIGLRAVGTNQLKLSGVERNNVAAKAVNAALLDDNILDLTAFNRVVVDNAIVANKLAVNQLSEIAPDAGIIVSGELRNAAGTRYINLDAVAGGVGSAGIFIAHDKFEIRADGSASFSGTLTATTVISGAIVAAGNIADGAVNRGLIITDDLIVNRMVADDQIVARHLFISTLSEIATDTGVIVSGQLRNATGTRYIDLDATGTQPFIAHDKFTLRANGNAEFAGTITSTATVTGRIIVAGNLANGAVDVTTVIADGVVTAPKIQVATLAAIQSNAGIIVRGLLRNGGNTRGIRLDSADALPGTWTTYLDLDPGASGPVLKHPAFELLANGNATFSGDLSAAGGTFSGEVAGDTFSAARAEFTQGWIRLDGTVSLVGTAGLTDTFEVRFGANSYLQVSSLATVAITQSADLVYKGRDIELGTIDSGGSGYRMLRVSNS